ncbi:MAG: hypothetical protein ACF8R7_08235 [Phycisphaerales bacterium JB039]
MVRLWLAWAIFLAGLPWAGGGAGAPAQVECPGARCCGLVWCRAGADEGRESHCAAPAQAEPCCPCMRPVPTPQPRPKMPLPRSGPTLTLAPPESPAVIPLIAVDTTFKVLGPTVARPAAGRGHNEVQAHLGVWRT